MFINRKELIGSLKIKKSQNFNKPTQKSGMCSALQQQNLRFSTKAKSLFSNKSPRWKQGNKYMLQEEKSSYLYSHIATK